MDAKFRIAGRVRWLARHSALKAHSMLPDSASASGTDEQFKDEHSVTRKRVLVADDHARILGQWLHCSANLSKSFVWSRTGKPHWGRPGSSNRMWPFDISMPGMSGIEVARELKRCASRTRIVF